MSVQVPSSTPTLARKDLGHSKPRKKISLDHNKKGETPKSGGCREVGSSSGGKNRTITLSDTLNLYNNIERHLTDLMKKIQTILKWFALKLAMGKKGN